MATTRARSFSGARRATLPGMRFASLGPFFALTFALGWGVAALLIVFTDRIEAVFGPLGYTNPVFIGRVLTGSGRYRAGLATLRPQGPR
jgi:hypothetical protein